MEHPQIRSGLGNTLLEFTILKPEANTTRERYKDMEHSTARLGESPPPVLASPEDLARPVPTKLLRSPCPPRGSKYPIFEAPRSKDH